MKSNPSPDEIPQPTGAGQAQPVQPGAGPGIAAGLAHEIPPPPDQDAPGAGLGGQPGAGARSPGIDPNLAARALVSVARMAERAHVTKLARAAHAATDDKEFARGLALSAAASNEDWEDIRELTAACLAHYQLTRLASPAAALGLAVLVIASRHVNAHLAIQSRVAENDKLKADAAPAPAAPPVNPANN